MRRIIRLFILMLMTLWVPLAGCSTPAAPAPPPTAAGAVRASSTLAAAPSYREAAQPVTAQNASQIAYLGRLDSPAGTRSSLFQYAFSPDGTRLAALNNELLIVWDIITGRLLHNTSRRTITSLAYSPDRTELYALTQEGIVLVYDESGGLKTDFEALDTFSGPNAYHPSDGWLALGGRDGSVRVWQPAERTARATIQASQSEMDILFFSQDGTRLATLGLDFIIRVWDWQQRTPLREFWYGGEPFVQAAFSPDGTQLAALTMRELLLWDLASGERQHTVSLPSPSDTLHYAPNGQSFVTIGSELILWDSASGAEIWRVPLAGDSFTTLAFSPDSSLLVTATFEQGVTLWNLATLGADSIQRSVLPVESVRITDVAWSADGFTLSLFEASGSVFIWGIPG